MLCKNVVIRSSSHKNLMNFLEDFKTKKQIQKLKCGELNLMRNEKQKNQNGHIHPPSESLALALQCLNPQITI